MFTNLKNSFTSRVNDKCVVKWLIAPKILGYTTLWFIINCNTYFRMMPFFCIHISQGSVTTYLKRGGIFKHESVANLLPNRYWKNFENRFIVSEVMAKSLVSCFFDSRCSSEVTVVTQSSRSQDLNVLLFWLRMLSRETSREPRADWNLKLNEWQLVGCLFVANIGLLLQVALTWSVPVVFEGT